MTKTQRQPVLVTGGAGYIGSHTVLELLLAGYPVVVLDNLSIASPEALALLRCLQRTPVRRFVFSSSATVYGDPESVPLSETSRTGPTNPYGRSKWMIEFMLEDLAAADPAWAAAAARRLLPKKVQARGGEAAAPAATARRANP